MITNAISAGLRRRVVDTPRRYRALLYWAPGAMWRYPLSKRLALPNTPGVASFAMTSSPSTVSTTLLSILRDDLNIDLTRVTPDARLVDDVGLDSVAFAVGMVAIEERLGVALSEEELLTCDTVGELEAAIAAKYRDE